MYIYIYTCIKTTKREGRSRGAGGPCHIYYLFIYHITQGLVLAELYLWLDKHLQDSSCPRLAKHWSSCISSTSLHSNRCPKLCVHRRQPRTKRETLKPKPYTLSDNSCRGEYTLSGRQHRGGRRDCGFELREGGRGAGCPMRHLKVFSAQLKLKPRNA